MKQRQMEIIKYPSWIDEVGEYVGALRQISNYNKTISNPKFDRKHLNNSRNQLGLKGELIYALYLERKNKEYKMPVIWGGTAITSYDFRVNETNIDVKTTEGKKLHVNKDEHENKKKAIDWYAFIVLTGNLTAELYYYAHEEVTSWGVTESEFTPVYQLNLKK
jgi:hypothetical protein